jgi:basic membrane protein A
MSKFLAVLLIFISVSAYADFKVALVLDRGGKDDKSFNASAFAGMTRAEKELKLTFKYVEATDDNAYATIMRSFSQKKFDLIIGIGVAQMDAIKKVASEFPEVHFAIVDATVVAPNVRSLMFKEHEGSFLVGAAAAMTSKSGKIGFIGGMDIPLIRRFEMGYLAGAKQVNPKIEMVSNFVGITSDSWNNPAKAKELALAQYNKGADVIYTAAGASSMGLFDAAEEKQKFAIGVDSNQNWVKPGHILTSMLKRIDIAVFETCKLSMSGKFSGEVQYYGLENSGVDYAIDQYNEKLLPDSVRKKIDGLKKEIITGKIKVPDYYKQAKK